MSDPWLQSYLGKRIPLPLFNNPSAITLDETAWVLSGIGRFGARTTIPYTVAEHSVRVFWCARDLGGTTDEQWRALNHEGDEALLGFDPPSPMLSLLPDLKWLKHEAHKAYCARYGMDPVLPAIVKQADMILLATERRDLMVPCEHEWMPMPPALPSTIVPISQHREDIRDLFAGEWRKLAVSVGLPRERW
jgi:uncharacterized protein